MMKPERLEWLVNTVQEAVEPAAVHRYAAAGSFKPGLSLNQGRTTFD